MFLLHIILRVSLIAKKTEFISFLTTVTHITDLLLEIFQIHSGKSVASEYIGSTFFYNTIKELSKLHNVQLSVELIYAFCLST